jgi:sorting and assembly machinery component 37
LIRSEAIKRAEHLGLAELDTDFDPNSGLHLTAGRDALPETFRRHIPLMTKKTIRDEMTPEQATAIRLFGLTEDCFTVLDELMQGKDENHPRFFADATVTSLDCLAFGYLALMQKPSVPRAFLKDWLESKTPRLHKFIDSMLINCITERGDLPWVAPSPTSALSFSSRILDSVMRHLPNLGEQYAAEMRYRAEQQKKGLDQRALVVIMGAVLTGLATGYGFHTYRAMQPFGAATQSWQPRRTQTKLSEFGQLGSMLSSAMGPFQSVPSGLEGPSGMLVEVDSEVD